MEECRCAFCESVYGKDEDFKEYRNDPICNGCYIECLEEEIKDLKEDLKNNIMEWISVKDRLPEEGKAILVYGNLLNEHENSKGASTGYYMSDIRKFMLVFSQYKCIDITHWKPLPNPPKH